MKELESTGTWPEHAYPDINAVMRMMTESTGGTPCVDVYLSRLLECVLDHRFIREDFTYRHFLDKNGIANIHLDRRLKENVAIVRYKEHEAAITNIKINTTKHCDFCGGEINLNYEAVKLPDDRLVCNGCYIKVFDTILMVGGEEK